MSQKPKKINLLIILLFSIIINRISSHMIDILTRIAGTEKEITEDQSTTSEYQELFLNRKKWKINNK